KEPSRLLVQQAKADLDAAKARRDKARKLLAQQELLENLQKQAIEAAKARVRAAEKTHQRIQEYHESVGNKSGHDLEVSQAKVQEAQAGLKGEEIKLEELR